jgi:hypothetical protein
MALCKAVYNDAHPVSFVCCRRVKVTFPTELRRTAIPEIPLLVPGQEAWVPMELVLSGLGGTSTF